MSEPELTDVYARLQAAHERVAALEEERDDLRGEIAIAHRYLTEAGVRTHGALVDGGHDGELTLAGRIEDLARDMVHARAERDGLAEALRHERAVIAEVERFGGPGIDDEIIGWSGTAMVAEARRRVSRGGA